MKIHRITSHLDPLYASFSTLYETAFPIHEKRTASHQITALRHGRYHLLCFLQERALIGFVGYWQFADYLYIEHYAIGDDFRGQGHGARQLKALLDSTTLNVILEIDPVLDSVSTKRLNFYQRLGFIENSYPHSHPAYRDGFAPHTLNVLSHLRPLSVEQYQQFKHDLDDIVMFKEG